MNVHVLPGDAQLEEFRKTQIEGDVVVCREAFVDGPATGESLEDLWSVRERYLAEAYPHNDSNYRDIVVAEFEKLSDLSGRAEVNLWFEYELFCHVNMWFCVWLLRDSKAPLFRVAPIVQRKDHVWDGFGTLTAEDLEMCYAERLRFTDRDIELGTDLWNAFSSRDHQRLRELSKIESACFPYLQQAIEAEIEKEIRPKQILDDLQNEGITEFGDVFAEFRQRAGVYGYGDSQVRRLMSES